MQPTIFQFDDFHAYLCYRKHREVRPGHYKLAVWSKRLGYKSPRLVGMVLKGQRLPSVTLCQRLSEDFGHTAKEHRYFELLIEKARLESKGCSTIETIKALRRCRPANKPTGAPLNIDRFAYIADWYHLVLRQLLKLQYFREDPTWIKSKLKSNLGVRTIKDAYQRMESLNILQRSGTGHLSIGHANLYTSDDIPSEAIQSHHQQMLSQAQESLTRDQVHEREITSITFALREEDLPAAKAAIKRFRDEFHRRFGKAQADQVAQLNVQFFLHTK